MSNEDISMLVTRWKVTYEYSGTGIITLDSKEAKDRFVASLKSDHLSVNCEVEEICIDRRQEVIDAMHEGLRGKLKQYAEKRELPLIEALDHLFKHYADD